MGVRLSKNLAKTDFSVRHVEVSEAGRARLKAEVGLTASRPRLRLTGPKW
ncbi:hypothetical protein ACFSHQ_00540 [Gemmobacter lanyuensis]